MVQGSPVIRIRYNWLDRVLWWGGSDLWSNSIKTIQSGKFCSVEFNLVCSYGIIGCYYMEFITPLIYLLINVTHAGWHWYLIEKRNRTIRSTQKIVEYSVLCLAAGLLLLPYSSLWPLIILSLLTRMAIFDPCLNLMRGKSIWYEGQINKRKSLWDYWESLVGWPVWVYRILYLLIYIGYLIYYLL